MSLRRKFLSSLPTSCFADLDVSLWEVMMSESWRQTSILYVWYILIIIHSKWGGWLKYSKSCLQPCTIFIYFIPLNQCQCAIWKGQWVSVVDYERGLDVHTTSFKYINKVHIQSVHWAFEYICQHTLKLHSDATLWILCSTIVKFCNNICFVYVGWKYIWVIIHAINMRSDFNKIKK